MRTVTYTILLTSFFSAFPLVGFAGTGTDFGGFSYFVVDALPVIVAITFGLIAGVAVLQTAQKIRGGVLASVYRDFGLGMLLIVLGLGVSSAPNVVPSFILERLHDLLFVAGFALMAYGSNKLLHKVGL